MSDDKLILRFAKIKSASDLRGALAHNLRLQDTPNADPAKRHLNQTPASLSSMAQCMSKFDELLSGQNVRKNAVLAHECLVTGSPGVINAMSHQAQQAFFRDAVQWLNKLHGGHSRLISASIHYDEATPHLHCIFVPLDSKNKLNSRSVLGGHRSRLAELQTEFANEVGVKHGLQRGRPKSKATHTTLKEYGALINEQLPELQSKLAALDLEVSEKQALVRELDERLAGYSHKFIRDLLAYYKAAEASPRLADWQRVQQSYAEMPKVAQNALQDVLAQGQEFDDKHIEPYRPRMR